MKKLLITSTALVALAIAAGANAATKWLTYPSCAATSTSLTCTGRAASIQPKVMAGLGPAEAAISGDVHYTCADPFFEFVWRGDPFPAPADIEYLMSTEIRSGKTFSSQYSPTDVPPALTPQAFCTSGLWTRDPNYYNVSVSLGYGFGSATPVTSLVASIGTVVAQ
jgi:hypothetical protein